MHASLLSRLLDRVTRPPVLTGFALLQVLVVVVLVARNAWALEGIIDARCEVLVGDYLAFHTGARLLATGEGAALYDLEQQRALQETLTGCSLARWQPYVNPPLFALALVPFSALGVRAGFHLFGVFVMLALVAALVAFGRALPGLASVPGSRATGLLLAFGFAPVASTLAGGQNTALSLALCAALYAALHARRDVLAGTWLGLLSYKPTLLPVLLVVVALRGRWRVLAVAGALVVAHYLLGAVLVGPDWMDELAETGIGRRSTPALVADLGSEFAGERAREWEANLPTHVSLVPFVERLAPGSLGSLLGYALALATLVATLLVARRASSSEAAMWGVAFGAMLLASPHLPYYDFGLVALPVLLGVEERVARGLPLPRYGRLALVVGYLGYPVHALSERLGWQPLAPALVLVFAWLWRQGMRAPHASAQPQGTRSNGT